MVFWIILLVHTMSHQQRGFNLSTAPSCIHKSLCGRDAVDAMPNLAHQDTLVRHGELVVADRLDKKYENVVFK
jgi:hypothetical protein